MTKTIKYCSYPVEDGRCGVSFSTHGIRSSRKYCDEHLRKQGVLTRSTNAFSKVQDRETMRDYVRKEMQSTELTRTELTTKINTNHYNIRTELKEIKEILSNEGVYRILIDNFNYADTRKAVALIGNTCLTESSGGINENTIRRYADCGVDFISSGALTHSVYNLDLSLKAF